MFSGSFLTMSLKNQSTCFQNSSDMSQWEMVEINHGHISALNLTGQQTNNLWIHSVWWGLEINGNHISKLTSTTGQQTINLLIQSVCVLTAVSLVKRYLFFFVIADHLHLSQFFGIVLDDNATKFTLCSRMDDPFSSNTTMCTMFSPEPF